MIKVATRKEREMKRKRPSILIRGGRENMHGVLKHRKNPRKRKRKEECP